MKKYFLVFSLFLVSCGSDTVSVSKVEYDNLVSRVSKETVTKPEYPKPIENPFINPGENIYNSWSIQIQDSCEYINTTTIWTNGGPIYTHKGNCKFCEHRLDVRFEKLKNELIESRTNNK